MMTIEEARVYYPANDPAHDFDHVLRVLALALRLAERAGADAEIVQTAALLHDTARPEEQATGADHALQGAARARQVLAGRMPAEKVEAVAQAIAAHRYRNALVPQTLEAQVLYDADKLDSIGAVGVARAYAIAGVCGQPLWAEVEPGYRRRKQAQAHHNDLNAVHTPVHEFDFKLSQVAGTLFTPAAREIARERHAYMVQFFQRLAQEVHGQA
jgi:uncharacterized protein